MMNDFTNEKLFKASILLGITLGAIKAMYWTELDDDQVGVVMRESMDNLIKLLEKGIDEIFYNNSGWLIDE